MEGFGVQGMPCTCDLGCAEELQQAAPSLRHSMPVAGTLSRSRLLLYVGRMEGFGVQGMPCTCDLGRAEEPQQAALRERNQLPRPTLTGRPSCMLWAAATATRRLLAASAMSGRGVVPSRRQSKK